MPQPRRHPTLRRPLTVLPFALLAAAAVLAATAATAEETTSAAEVLERSIAFHDPEGLWDDGSFVLAIDEARPDGGGRWTELRIDNGAGTFAVRSEHRRRVEGAEGDEPAFEEHVTETALDGDRLIRARLDGSADFSAEEAERFRLTEERARWMRNYYLYLWGLPMKLQDPGTRAAPEARRTEWRGRDAWEVKVTYDPEVGGDLWYFYFDPEDYRLVGYRFHHDATETDGEYIPLEGLVEVGGLRLPAARSWYTVADDRLLGTDTLLPR